MIQRADLGDSKSTSSIPDQGLFCPVRLEESEEKITDC